MSKSVGDSIIEGLGEFRDALKSGRPVAEQLTCRRVVLDLEIPGGIVRPARSIPHGHFQAGGVAMVIAVAGCPSQKLRPPYPTTTYIAWKDWGLRSA